MLVATAERLAAEGSNELAGMLARLVERRYADTPAAARASALLASMRRDVNSRAGRAPLIAAGTIYGAWLGIAVPLMLDSEAPEAYGLGLLVGAPAGFFGARGYARGRSVSGGDAGTIIFSGAWGTWQGGALQAIAEFGTDQTCDGTSPCYDTNGDFRYMIASMVIGGLTGITASAIVADRVDIGGGTATLIGSGALWGTWFGSVAAVLAELDGEDATLTAAVVGGDVGLLAMAVLGPRLDWSAGRAWLVNAGGVMGLAMGGGIDLLITPDNEKVAIAIPAIGSALGLWLGARLTSDMDGDDRTGARDAVGGESLVNLRDGAWSLALPRPAPALARVGSGAAAEAGFALHVPLLDARF